jgi:hypothetical protein
MKHNTHNTSKEKIYENCRIYHPDGTLMCYCTNKRLNWYLKRNLANKLDDVSIQLTFEPKGKGDPLALLQPRQSICVVSGLADNLSKHHVIPYEFRKFFPLKYKDKNSCDVVILERNIHNEYEEAADILKKRLYDDFVSDVWKELNYSWTEAKLKYRVINGEYFDKIPPAQQIFIKMRYEGIIEKYGFTQEQLTSKSSPYCNEPNKEIVDKIGIENLIVLWKLHFIKYANPVYLPDWWKPNLIKITKSNDLPDIKHVDLDSPLLKLLIKRYDLDI